MFAIVDKIRNSFTNKLRAREILTRVTWMINAELVQVSKLEETFRELQGINSVFLSPGIWLAVANPQVVEIAKKVNFITWTQKLDTEIFKLEEYRDRIEGGNLESAIEYLESRVTQIDRFPWRTHRELEMGPKEAVEAKFGAEATIRAMIADLKRITGTV